MNRVPIRLRLTMAFTLAMAVLLAAAGLFLYLRLQSDLSRSLDQTLRQRAEDLATLVREPHTPLSDASPGLVERGESFAQVLDTRGALLESTPTVGDRPLLDQDELARARLGAVFTNRQSVAGLDEPARLLATPVSRERDTVVLVVGATRQNGIETLTSLRTELFIGGPLTLLATALGGYLLAGAAFRPIEAMRRRADEITATEPGQRLPLGNGRDELARLGATLNDMLGRLEAALERERNFVADAGHELRTPLALLKTELELALRHPRPAAELRSAIESAAEEADRLTHLAENLLVIASADQRRLSVRREPTDAGTLLRQSTTHFAAQAADGRIIHADSDAGVVLLADRVRLEQALRNLLDNALRHGSGEVRVFARRRGDQLELHVTDDGPGFPADYLPRAFERFSRPDTGRTGGGTGLGLSIVHATAHAHGGTAHAANRPEGGADVWLVLPIA
jgi:heavy metal sensor kinase